MNRCYSQATHLSSPSYNFLHNLLCFMEGQQRFSTNITNGFLLRLPRITWLLSHLLVLAGPWLLPQTQRTLSLLFIWELSLSFISSPFLWPALRTSCGESFFGFVSASPSLGTSYPPFSASFLPPFISFPTALRRGAQRLLSTIASFAVLSKTLVICTS